MVHHTPPPAGFPRAFTLAELLVVLLIVGILVAILIPTVGRVRLAGQSADTRAMLTALDNACQAYFQDHKAWPGVFPEGMLGTGVTPQFNKGGNLEDVMVKVSSGDFTGDGDELENVTGAENMALSLLGGIRFEPDTSDPTNPDVVYDPAAVGRGPSKLSLRSPGGYPAYFESRPADLSMHIISDEEITPTGGSAADVRKQWGRFVDESGAARDSIVPEFVDRYTNRMPFLYLRAQSTGRLADPATFGNSIISAPAAGVPPTPTFDFDGIHGYVTANNGAYIGVGKNPQEDFYANGVLTAGGAIRHGLDLASLTDTGVLGDPARLRDTMVKAAGAAAAGPKYTYPYDARAYFLSPSTAAARRSDTYVLLSAGPDRIYGTEDDITNFGAVKQ